MRKYLLTSLLTILFSYVYTQEARKDSINTITKDWLFSDVLSEVVITGQLKNVAKKNAVHDIEVITSEVLNSGLFTDLSNILSFQNNIKISNDNILGSSINLQGVSGENIKILIDGVPVIGRLNGNIDVSQINLSNIDRIEVIEGPLSVDFGSDALAGTINIITKKEFKNKWTGSLNSYYETVGKYNNELFVNYQYKKHSFSNQFGRNYFSGWSKDDPLKLIPEATLADTNRFKKWKPKEQVSNKLQHIIKLKNITLRNYNEYFYEKITNRGFPKEPYFNFAFDDYYYTYRTNFGSEFILTKRKYKINSLIAFNNYRRIKNTVYKNLTNLSENIVPDYSLQDTSIFNMFMWKSLYSSNWNVTDYLLGIDIVNQNSNGMRILNKYQFQTDYALFVNTETNLNHKIKLRNGLRFIYNTTYKAPIIPSINLLYTLKKNTQIRCSYAKGFRAPSLKELFFEFVDINHNITGNPNLLAEKGDNLRFSITNTKKNKKNTLTLKGSAFYNDIKNKISLANINNEYSYFNIEQHKTLGGDIKLTFMTNKLSLNSTISYVGRSNNIQDSSKNTPKFNYSTDYTLNFIISVSSDIKINCFYKYNGELESYTLNDNAEIIKTLNGAYSLLDFSITQAFFNKKLILNIGAKNLLNITDISISQNNNAHSNGNNLMPVGYGRSFFTSIKFSL